MQSTSPWHTPTEKRNNNNYRAGWNAYVNGAKYSFHANIHWQRGFKDARDSAAGIDRAPLVVGGDAGRDRD